ncbi:hypothetical protein ACFVXH_39685 [Kitasatospora sp. NPDC058184]|uniref:hypothetical protein n=1 Tax=Kitasatospora sp. NPDC058184 TaxID=3346370 RepID=UPI0036DDE358
MALLGTFRTLLAGRTRAHTTRAGLDQHNTRTDQAIRSARERADRTAPKTLTDPLSYQPVLLDARATALDLAVHLEHLGAAANWQEQPPALVAALYDASDDAAALAERLTAAANATLPAPAPAASPVPDRLKSQPDARNPAAHDAA